MADNAGPNEGEVGDTSRPRRTFSAEHLRKLLVERHGIRAALENPGGSIIIAGPARAADAEEVASYSSIIGNDYHLDLLDAELQVNALPVQDRIELLSWCDGLAPKDAAYWANVVTGTHRSINSSATRKRMNRAAEKVANGMNDNGE